MKKKLKVEEVQELPENEEFVSDDDVDIEVSLDEEDNSVYVRFSGFSDSEDAEEYAAMLANTLPLLLFESTRLQ
jgi:hypothetical protein